MNGSSCGLPTSFRPKPIKLSRIGTEGDTVNSTDLRDNLVQQPEIPGLGDDIHDTCLVRTLLEYVVLWQRGGQGEIAVSIIRHSLLFLSLFVLCQGMAYSAETDQFLVWGVELEDSSEAINRYLNTEIERFLEERNRLDKQPCNCQELINKLYLYFFKGLHASRLRNWLHHSSEVDRYPDSSVSYFQYQRMSVYRGHSFPYILPISRTIRVGDVYCGIDKLAHFFGFGRRFYNRYLRLRAKGYTEEQAMEKVVLTVVGKLVDGIFSHADLEAGFQGSLMARDLCNGERPHIQRNGNKWVLVRPIDIKAYVTPDFDESYNPSHYWALRKRFVLPLLKEEYRSKASDPAVQKRFARYRLREPSFSRRTIEMYFNKKGRNPQREQFFEAFGLEPVSPALHPVALSQDPGGSHDL